MKLSCLLAVLGGGAALFLAGCGTAPKAAPQKSEAPAKISGPALKEGELASITLTPEAESRLGIRVAQVTSGRGNELRRFAADVMLPPGRSLIVTAPVSGSLRTTTLPLSPGTVVKKDQLIFEITPLLPLPRDLRVTAEADVEQARTRLNTAKLRKARADKMLKDEVGTVRAQEEARNELDLATSALQAAQARLDQIKRAPLEGDVTVAVRAPRDGMIRQVLAAPGQPVNGGAALFEIADLQTLWLRVPVYSGETAIFSPGSAVSVETLSGKPIGTAHSVQAPPTGDPLAATVDFYYEAPASSHILKPGEKVAVALISHTSRQWNQVPFAAVVYDIHGGGWVYEKAADHRYVRRRVQVDHTAGGYALLASSPAAGTPVVVEGVAELWGTEFGAGK
jgi:membrane fusion protein, heavy metal efflux system